MKKLDFFKELIDTDIFEEVYDVLVNLTKFIGDRENEKALEKAFSLWEKHEKVNKWFSSHFVKYDYTLWIGKRVFNYEDILEVNSKVIFKKEKDAYTWSSSKKYACVTSESDKENVKGGYLLNTTADTESVIFDIFELSKMKIDDTDHKHLLEYGFSSYKIEKLTEIFEVIDSHAFKELVICNDTINSGVVSANWKKTADKIKKLGNWKS